MEKMRLAEEDQGWRRLLVYLPVSVVLVVGLLFSALLYIDLHQRHVQRTQLGFEGDVSAYILAFELKVQATLRELVPIAFQISDSPPQSAERFAAMMQPYFARNVGIQALLWAPATKNPIGESQTRPLSSAEDPPGGGTRPPGDGAAMTAAREEWRFPIQYITPEGLGGMVAGFDLASDPDIQRAIWNAARRREMFPISGAAALRHAAGTGNVMGIMPVYDDLTSDAFSTEAVGNFRGVVAGIFDVGKILDAAVRRVKPSGVNIHIFDTYAPYGFQLLAVRRDPTSTLPAVDVREDDIIASGYIHFRHLIEFGTRRWTVFCTPTGEYLAATQSWWPWVGVAVVLYFTGLLALYLIKNIGRTREIEALVRRRTAELRSANDRLRWEITERKRFEQERDDLLRLLEDSNASLERLNHRLVRSNEDLQDFAFVVSHDLKEPLRKIRVFAERLKSRSEEMPDDRRAEYLELILDSTKRMQSLIAAILDISRVVTHGQPFRMADLGAVAQEVLADLAVRLEETGGQVMVADLPAIECDPTQIRQVLQNLIDNALKFHRPGVAPQITVTGAILSPEEAATMDALSDMCRIEVRDNGIGFDESASQKIFSLFQRLYPQEPIEGSGIGLAVCRKIVERHGGTITVSSTPGQGSIFTILLPLRHVAAQHSDLPLEPAPMAEAAGSEVH